MSESGTGAGRRRQEWRREQRRIARALHPDLGTRSGADPDEFVQQMRELNLRFGIGPGRDAGGAARPATGGSPTVVVRATAAGTIRRGLRVSRHVVRAVRARLPRALPGARRYIDLRTTAQKPSVENISGATVPDLLLLKEQKSWLPR